MALQTLFGALSDETRFAIVEALLQRDGMTATEIAAPFDISKPAISRHLKVLEDAGLIERRIDRQFRVFSARREGFEEIENWVARYRRFWNTSFDRLERLIEKNKQNGDSNG